MNQTKQDINVNEWIEISISDLLSSRILYYASQHPQSYFYFQQAVEKANKALALYIGSTEKELRNISHDQMKIFKRVLKDKKVEVEKIIDFLDRFPNAKTHSSLKSFNFSEYHKSLISSLSTIEHLKEEDLVNLSTDVIEELIWKLEEIEDTEIQIPKYSDPTFKALLANVSDIIGQFDSESRGTTKLEFDKSISQKNGLQLWNKFLKNQTKVSITSAYIEYAFLIFACFTIQHSSLTRYIDGKHNPLKLYSKKLSLVKKQPELMDIFEKALLKFKTLVNQKMADYLL